MERETVNLYLDIVRPNKLHRDLANITAGKYKPGCVADSGPQGRLKIVLPLKRLSLIWRSFFSQPG
jgi:hypothetical protein